MPLQMATGYTNINDRQISEPVEDWIRDPHIPRGSLALKSGESVTEEKQEQYPDGVLAIRKLTLTIK